MALTRHEKTSIYLGYHTLNQVLAGSSVGILFGCVWYGTTCYCYTTGLVDYIVELTIAKKLYLRDMRSIDNVAKWEYQQWQKQRLNKQK
jgi:dolichyldiphosphatase